MAVLSNAKHERFAQGLAKGETADAAYIAAGYKPHTSNPARLSGNERIKARVAELLGRAASKTEITVARVLEEFGKIAFADIRGIFGPGGNLINPGDMTDEMAAAVQSVEVIVRRVPGDEKHVEEVHKLKLHDKLGALTQVARHLGMFVDRSQVEHAGGVTIQFDRGDADL